MATDPRTPQFYGPDGVLRENFIFSTDLSFRFFTGVVNADTVDMQVSIRGGAYTSNPDYISFEGTSFIVPNPTAFPDGLQLLPGDNPISVRSIMSNGDTSPEGKTLARLSLDRDVKAGVTAPSGVYVERFDRLVRIYVDGLTDPNVTGYQFYASTAPGGGAGGYKRISITQVSSGDVYEKTQDLGEMTVDAIVARDQDGNLAAEPLYLQTLGYEVDRTGKVIQTDYNQLLNIPDTVTQLKTTMTVQSVQRVNRFSFPHSRTATNQLSSPYPAIPRAEFSAIPETDPLYYVVTAVYMIDGKEYESSYSPEVAASPLVVTPLVSALPTVNRQQITQNTILSIYRSHPELDLKPGSVIRDTYVDPFATEAERIRFILGFVQDCQTFTTLLAVDDPTNSGTSLPVNASPYKQGIKQAFYLASDQDVQNLIDNAFDHLAAQRGVFRRYGKKARGECTFYITYKPTSSVFVPLGTICLVGAQRFITTSAGYISVSGTGSSFDPTTGRYFVRLFLQAEAVGKEGNVTRGQIRTVVNGPAGLQCINEVSMFGGRSNETNRELATRADGVLSSVDTGTYRGYLQTTNDVSGVLECKVIDAGNSLMKRDINPATGQHTGGKVDVWTRGENIASIQDSFAFSFQIVERGQFEPLGNLSDLRFRAINTDLSTDNPIMEMLDFPDWGYQFTDDTTGKVFDLTDVVIEQPDVIQLSATYNDPANIALSDIFRGSYRYRTSNKVVLQRQPVRRITKLEGDPTRSGVIDPSLYKLYQGSQPLDYGRSVESGDYMLLVQPIGETPVQIPSSDPISVSDERHVLLGKATEYLNNLGINPLTVHVYSVDRHTEYYGPYAPNVEPDFTIVDEVGDYPLGIKPTANSRLTDGLEVSVDYQHDENFVVTYDINSLVSVAQNDLDATRHITADVLAKEAYQVGVNIKATVVLRVNTSVDSADSSIRTALARLFGTFKLGTPVRQSDIIGAIEALNEVSYVVVPITLMTKSDGSQVVMESVTTDSEIDYAQISAWSSDIISTFILKNPLVSGTINSGGEMNDTKGVYLGDTLLNTYDSPPDGYGVPLCRTTYGAFIIGNEGMSIPGFSDDSTLQQQYPFATLAEIDTYRTNMTAGRILVTLPAGSTPLDQDFSVTYVVYGDSGVKNIEPGPIHYLVLGDLEFTYDEDLDFSSLVSGGQRSR